MIVTGFFHGFSQNQNEFPVRVSWPPFSVHLTAERSFPGDFLETPPKKKVEAQPKKTGTSSLNQPLIFRGFCC